MSATSEKATEPVRGRMLESLIEALSGKQSEINLNFHRTTIGIPRFRTNVELNGTISLTVHMRDMTESEKEAYALRASTTR